MGGGKKLNFNKLIKDRQYMAFENLSESVCEAVRIIKDLR